jgi:hypothetical protein
LPERVPRRFLAVARAAHDFGRIQLGATIPRTAVLGVHAKQRCVAGVLLPAALVSARALSTVGIEHYVAELAADRRRTLKEMPVGDDTGS